MPWFETSIEISELIAIFPTWKLWQSNDFLFFKICYSALWKAFDEYLP